ncbi:membrane protein [Bifidobacteriaceae bacterium MCC01971]|nr:membrane protein [Bifidobacteriaceae bacterium MCC01971]
MTRGFLSDVLAKWKRFRWQGLVKVWAMFMAIALVLLVESLGVHYGATRFDITYLDRDKAIPAADAIAGEKATNLLVIDSSQEGVSDAESMLDRVLLDMKVPTVTVDLAQGDEIPTLKQYQTMVIAMPNLDPLGEHVLQIMQWVKKGGGVMFAMTPEKTGYLDVIGPQIGIESSAYKYVVTEGITPSEDFMLGGGQTYMFSDPFKSSLSVALNDRAQVEAVSSNGRTPLVWRSSVESGTAVMCNIGIYVKMVRGFYASAFSLLSSAMAYPVINSAAFYLDDFPSPVPSGNGKYIKRDYNMSISEFYSQVWWPDLVRLAERYGIRFTGVMIENYGDDTKNDPVRQTDNTQFEYYGGLLLRQNGEIGYHGYNHQPLVLPNTDYGNEYTYVQWPNRKAIVDSLNELIAFQKTVLPAATSSVYVPPSNILSSEGRQIIGEDVPQIRAIASMAFPPDSSLEYVQEFGVAADGVVEAPRIVSGSMVNNSYMRLAAVSELNMHYVSTHFMHPDDLLDEDRGAKEGWETYRKGLEDYLDWLEQSAPSIRMQTGTECAAAVQRFSGLTVSMATSDDSWDLHLGNLIDQGWLMFRANNGTPGRVRGGSLTKLTGNLYLLKATSATVHIERKTGGES